MKRRQSARFRKDRTGIIWLSVASVLITGIRRWMKFFDVCVLGLVSIVFLSRFPSPLHSFKCHLISTKRLTMLSAVCDLLGLLVACDYVASRFSAVGPKYLGWIAAQVAGWVASGLLSGPACQAFISGLFGKNSSRKQPVKAALSPRLPINK